MPALPLLKRLLKQLGRSAKDGLERLEDVARRAGAAISAEHRFGTLADLARIALTQPCLLHARVRPARSHHLGRGQAVCTRRSSCFARLGLLVETSWREAWRSYVIYDVAMALGLASRHANVQACPQSPRQPSIWSSSSLTPKRPRSTKASGAIEAQLLQRWN